jgi:uncharacterized protein (DUF486 family)
VKHETENLQISASHDASNCKSAKIDCRTIKRLESGPKQTGTVMPIPYVTVGLLLASNIFMTFAWYGHLKYKTTALVTVIMVSWGIAFFEYCLMVPANRIGHGHFSAAELKTIQEVITLSVFAVFSVLYLKEPLMWNHLAGFAFIALGAFFIFHKWA